MDRNSEVALPQATNPPAATIPSEALDQGSCDVYGRHIDLSLSGPEKSVEDLNKDLYDALHLKNSLTHFHKMPPEIHANILYLSLIDKQGWHDHYKQLHVYARVSCLWKSLVLNTPALWSRLSSNMDPQLCVTALARLGNCPLDVEFNAFAVNVDAFSLITPAIPRWGSINMTWNGRQDSVTLRSALEQPMPNLRSARLQVMFTPLTSPVNLGAGHAPLLKVLVIESVTVPWDPSVLWGLKSLRMCGITGHAPTWAQLHDLLQNAVHLESLTLADMHVFDLSTTSKPSSPINLPSLRHLHLGGVEPFVLRNMFEAFHLPNCDTCDTRLYLQYDSIRNTFTSATNHMLPIFGALANMSSDVSILLSYRTCDIRATIVFPDEGFRTQKIFRVYLEQVADPHEFPKWIAGMGIDKKPPGAMDLIIQRLHDPNTTPTEADIVYPDRRRRRPLTTVALDALKSAIDLLPIVSELRLMLEDEQVDPLLEYLTPSSGTRTAVVEEWPLPQLQELYIRGDSFTPDCLLAMMRARCGRGGIGYMESGRLCKTLERLELDYVGKVPEHVKKEIYQLLGRNNFVCKYLSSRTPLEFWQL